MPFPRVVFVDTSIILRLIGIDGEDLARDAATEFDTRRNRGEQFVLPVTALIEAGNRIVGLSGDRRWFAEQLKSLIEAASKPDPPWILREAPLDQHFIKDLLEGDSTGSDLVTLLGDGRLGTGDLAILVERDQFKKQTAYTDVVVWSLDEELAALS